MAQWNCIPGYENMQYPLTTTYVNVVLMIISGFV